jgi:hypothetical protein
MKGIKLRKSRVVITCETLLDEGGVSAVFKAADAKSGKQQIQIRIIYLAQSREYFMTLRCSQAFSIFLNTAGYE